MIDDGSTDRTGDIIASYSDHRIVCVNNERNLGLTKSLNVGIHLAQGKYIARQDADDLSLPERLERQVYFMEQHAQAAIVGSSWHVIDGQGKTRDVSKTISGAHALHFMCHGSIMMRKPCVEALNGYREFFEYAQDYDLYLRVVERYEVSNLQEPLYKLRVHDESLSVKKRHQQMLYAALALELAEERKKSGTDCICVMNAKDAIAFREQRLNVSGIHKRKLLARVYSTWSQAAYESSDYQRSVRYIFDTHHCDLLNARAWITFIKILTDTQCHQRMTILNMEMGFLARKGVNICKKVLKKIYTLMPIRP